MTGLFQVDGKMFKSHQEAGRYIRSLTPAHIKDKTLNKLIMNSTYGFMPGSVAQKLGRYRELARSDDERNATIWRRLFGERKTKPAPYKPLPGGASLGYASSQIITLIGKPKAEEITKTGQQKVREMLSKMAKLDV